jgi:hypothetical protein
MFATAISARLDRAGVHYGWVIVAVTFVTLLTTAGAMGLPGALILSLNKEFGWDTGEISSALALRLALFGLMGPFQRLSSNGLACATSSSSRSCSSRAGFLAQYL